MGSTAGLGIFWVANQQLPVFDWHYLFGYATLLLLALHLAFNWRVVWRFLVRRAAPDASVGAAPLPRRRRALALFGTLAAVGAAYWAGWRSGRSQAQAGSDIATPDADPGAAMAMVERFHAQSSNSRGGVLLRAPGVDWGDAPAPFKQYPGAARIALPNGMPAAGAPFDLAALATVLWHTAGITAVRAPIRLRASPSSGALFATELYVAVRSLPGLPAGVWHYDALGHALERLEGDAPAAAQIAAAADETALQGAAAIVVATAVFRRSGHKYRDRTYRYLLADLGHAIENLRVAAIELGAQCRFAMRFDEARCAAALGLDEAEEGVLAWLALIPRPPAAPVAPPAQAAAAASAPAPPQRAAAAKSSPLGITGAMHAATSLAAPRVAPQRAALAPQPAAGAITLPPAPSVRADALRVIATRRSVRRFSGTALELDVLSAVLGALMEPQASLSQALRVAVVVNAVAGLAPGAYRYDAQRHVLEPRRVGPDLRAAARAAALDQDVIGDAQAVFVLGVDREALQADPAGALRGYRHALLQAGCIGELIYLAAGARGLAACAVGAFYDAEAAALVGADPAREWVLHLVALGVPA
ncbi:MAG: SagB family peptide dehydrogenase [Ideonella sp.]|nr:SagB family peptide dehydrogenase [Ideonella sp.]